MAACFTTITNFCASPKRVTSVISMVLIVLLVELYVNMSIQICNKVQSAHEPDNLNCDITSSFVWGNSFIHCLAALDFGASVEQPFGCLIVQNHQAVQSMGRSMDWMLEDDMVEGLFFCATLTGRRGGHTPFVQAGAETSDTSAEVVKLDPGSSCKGHSGGMGASVGDENAESCVVVRPLHVPLMIMCPLRRTYVVVVREADELLCGGYKWVSRFQATCNSTHWTGERWVEQMSYYCAVWTENKHQSNTATTKIKWLCKVSAELIECIYLKKKM